MALNTQKINNWIREHKLFALALPVAILLLVFFVATSLKGIKDSYQKDEIGNGYNNSLPGQSNELEIKDPNTYYKESLKDSLERTRKKSGFATMVDREKENDSLEKILRDLESFSLVESNTETALTERPIAQNTDGPESRELSETEKRIEYRTMLQRARQERKTGSQDFSAPTESAPDIAGLLSKVKVRASVYKDQFVVPGSRVTLILREDLQLAGRIFPKNTFVYATANIQRSRLMMDIHNIGDFPVSLKVYDEEDGGLGIHNERAGELLREFYADMEEGAVQEVSRELSDGMDLPMTKNAIRVFGKFFGERKRKDRDEIVLINGYKVYLKT